MHRIEDIAGVLEGSAVVTLAASIKPDWDLCEEGEALLTQFDLGAEDVHGIHQTTEELDINPV